MPFPRGGRDGVDRGQCTVHIGGSRGEEIVEVQIGERVLFDSTLEQDKPAMVNTGQSVRPVGPAPRVVAVGPNEPGSPRKLSPRPATYKNSKDYSTPAQRENGDEHFSISAFVCA